MTSSSWITCTLFDVTEKIIDYRGKTPLKLGGDWTLKGYRAISAKNIKSGRIVEEKSIRYLDEPLYKKWMKDEIQKYDVLITSEAPFGEMMLWTSDEKIVLSQRVFAVRLKKLIYPKYGYYYLSSKNFYSEMESRASGTTVVGLRQPELLKCTFKYPDYQTQVFIGDILTYLDNKIEINNKINKTLEEMAQAIFKSWFVDFDKNKDEDFQRFSDWEIPVSFRHGKAESFFDISIGKTPPRKESEWFSYSSKDVKWLSISDMGNSGIFVQKTSEYLTLDAIRKFNVQIVPPKTVMLSFKLTIGRVSISDDEIVTNEAIAHFKSTDPYIMEYIYLFLKNYEFSKLGSTSSIATATNSKVIKGMPIYIPNEELLKCFHDTVLPLFNKININQKENIILSEIRDSLLPKLMSGEIRVPFEEVSNA